MVVARVRRPRHLPSLPSVSNPSPDHQAPGILGPVFQPTCRPVAPTRVLYPITVYVCPVYEKKIKRLQDANVILPPAS